MDQSRAGVEGKEQVVAWARGSRSKEPRNEKGRKEINKIEK